MGWTKFALMLLIMMPGVASAEDGVWSKDGDFVVLPLGFCSQRWLCSPKEDILSSHGLNVTPPTSTRGACSVGGGPVDSCNFCLAAEPKAKCQWSAKQ
jgi:hypothetical protein